MSLAVAEKRQPLLAELALHGRRAGGVFYASCLLLVAIFVAALFDLRAEKILTLSSSIETASSEDLVAFWRAAALALKGQLAAAYDPDFFRAPFNPPNDQKLWLNPPHAALLLAPLALVSYGTAKGFLLGATVAALLLIARLTAPQFLLYCLILASPAAFASLLVYQVGPFIALGLGYALLVADRRPILCGLVLALLTMKPQYGLLAPLFLAATGNWRAIGAAAAFTALFCALSVAAFGVEAWRAFFASLSGAHTEHAARIMRDMVAIHETVGKLGGSAALRSIAQVGAMAAAPVTVIIVARAWPREAAVGLVLLLSAFVSPSLWVYDWPIVAAGLFLLATAAAPWPPAVQFLAALLWASPLFSLGFKTDESSLVAPAAFAATILAFLVVGRERWGLRLARS